MVQAWAPPPRALASARLEKTSMLDLKGSSAASVRPKFEIASFAGRFPGLHHDAVGEVDEDHAPGKAIAVGRLRRRGCWRVGAIASRNGSAIDTPRPLRAVRREIGRKVMAQFPFAVRF